MIQFDVTVPNVARIYDYLLGGKDNYAADREAAEALVRAIPDSLAACQQNRAFLKRAVTYLVRDAGVRQLIDIGSGLPTMENVHQIAHSIAPETRVVYVDYDAVVLSHARALLAADNVTIVQADVRNPWSILEHPQVLELIDFTEPVATLMVAIMHFISDSEHPGWIVDQFKSRMPPGSYLVLTHVTDEEVDPDKSKAAQQVYSEATAQVTPRSHDEILRFFDGLTIAAPGLVDINAWPACTPEFGPAARRLLYGGVGRVERSDYR